MREKNKCEIYSPGLLLFFITNEISIIICLNSLSKNQKNFKVTLNADTYRKRKQIDIFIATKFIRIVCFTKSDQEVFFKP